MSDPMNGSDQNHYSNRAIITLQASVAQVQHQQPQQPLLPPRQVLPQQIVQKQQQAVLQGSRITEITEEEHTEAEDTSAFIDVASANTAEVIQHPQAVHASPVLVLHDEQHRKKMRDRAFEASVESNV